MSQKVVSSLYQYNLLLGRNCETALLALALSVTLRGTCHTRKDVRTIPYVLYCGFFWLDVGLAVAA